MKSSSQSSVSRVLVISFVLFASLILFVSRAAAQEIGTVKNEWNNSITTTVRDTTYGPDGVKSTTTDSKGRVGKEELKGNKDKVTGERITFEEKIFLYNENGTKEVITTYFVPTASAARAEVVASYKRVTTDILGGVISVESGKFDKGEQTEGTKMIVDESGKKTFQEYDPKTKTFKDVEPAKTEEPKKEEPKKEEPKKEPGLTKEQIERAQKIINRQGSVPRTGGARTLIPRWTFYGGVSYMRAPDESAKDLIGGNVSIFHNFTPLFAFGGDFSALSGSTTDAVGTIKVGTSLHRQTYLAGPEFDFYRNSKAKIFIQGLPGVVHDTVTTTGTTTVSSSTTAFAVKFGGGVDVNVNKDFAIRPFQVDYMLTLLGKPWQKNFGISAGLVYRFGGKK